MWGGKPEQLTSESSIIVHKQHKISGQKSLWEAWISDKNNTNDKLMTLNISAVSLLDFKPTEFFCHLHYYFHY